MLKRWALLLLAMATMAAAQMQQNAMSAPTAGSHIAGSNMVECPWLTRGTAAAVLGGDVSLEFAMPSHSQGSCMFRGPQDPADTLIVTVSSVAPHACGKKSVKLVGVANWASLCMTSRSQHRFIESIDGQARNTYFTVTLSLRRTKTWRSKEVGLKHIAEMVAGNLY